MSLDSKNALFHRKKMKQRIPISRMHRTSFYHVNPIEPKSKIECFAVEFSNSTKNQKVRLDLRFFYREMHSKLD